MSTKRRIAIIGGGVAAMSAAFELTATPERRARHEVTVYQMGWRLGGKGASGRNRKRHDRIEEHGVHVWAGYYHNAFLLMRRCFEALDRPEDCPIRTIDEAFARRSSFSLQEEVVGQPRRWDVRVPQSSGMPGDGRLLPTLGEYLELLRDAAEIVADELWAEPWGTPDRRRRRRVMRDYLRTHLRGAIRDRLWKRGLSAIDNEDWSCWLRRHGAREETITSPLVRGIYDTMFAYRDGDPSQPALAAGRVLHTYWRFALAYRGALFWELQGGMGDVVFAPFYEVLRARGVRFRFFHRVDALRLDTTLRHVECIEGTQQAETRDDDYEPLMNVGGLPSWPAEPLWEQLQGGEALCSQRVDLEDPSVDPTGARRFVLKRDRDFDDVLLAVGRGAVPSICEEVVALDPRWQRMLHHTPTVTTHALQLWLRATAERLGVAGSRKLVAAGSPPLAIRSDMTHVVAHESWGPSAPDNCVYFCGVMPSQQAQTSEGYDWEGWLDDQAEAVFPRGARPEGGLDRGHVADVFYAANRHPSDRYVLTPPCSVRHRLGPDESGLANLFLAGDWVRTSYSLGTVESACIAGRLSARAILGEAIDIVGEPGC